VLGLVVLVGAVPRFVRPTLDRSEIRTARVEAGPVEATISATGTVVPEFEHVLSSPLDARVLRILRKPGASLKPGEPILDLDVSEPRLAYDKLVERVALKRNEEKRKRLGLARTLADLEGQAAVAGIDVEAFGIKLGQTQKLHDAAARRAAKRPPPLVTVAETDGSASGGSWSSQSWRPWRPGGPQGASISRPSSSTGTRTTSCTAGGGLGSSGGLRPR
jgi:multidrug efflux pump subunit AcrA (membrane-fusion protein)